MRWVRVWIRASSRCISPNVCREELAEHACKTQDVAALCFALSFTKSSTKLLPNGLSSTATRSQYWRETHLSPLHEAAAVGSPLTLLPLTDLFRDALFISRAEEAICSECSCLGVWNRSYLLLTWKSHLTGSTDMIALLLDRQVQ